MAGSKRWIVTMANSRSLSDIREELINNGFAVDQVLAEIGCITGTASDDVAQKLRSISGVVDVSPDGDINIGPPGAPVTW